MEDFNRCVGTGDESGEQKQLIFLLSKMFFGASEESQGKSDGV